MYASGGCKGHVVTDGSLLGTAGKWCACRWAVVQLDYDEEMGRCMGCMDRWRQNWRWTHQGPWGQQWEDLMGYEKVRRSVLSQEQEMQTCEKIGKNYMNWQKEASWWKCNM